MKKLFYGLIATLVFGNLSYGQEKEIIYSNSSIRIGDKIGLKEKESFIITFDEEKLLNDFSIIAKESGIDLKYEKVEILKANPGEKDDVFALYAYGNDGITTTAISLDLEKDTFVISKRGATITCSSTGCTGFGCTAYDNGTYWTCSSCTKACSKTVSVTIKAFDTE